MEELGIEEESNFFRRKMEIKVMGLFDAFGHSTDKPAYAIRIASTFTHGFEGLVPLGGDYKVVRRYIFDDMQESDEGFFKVLRFRDWIAQRIIDDFIEGREGCEQLLVHCHKGRSRGPAVAKALNDIFYLGNSDEEMSRICPRYNRFVYDTMMRTAERMGVRTNVPAL